MAISLLKGLMFVESFFRISQHRFSWIIRATAYFSCIHPASLTEGEGGGINTGRNSCGMKVAHTS